MCFVQKTCTKACHVQSCFCRSNKYEHIDFFLKAYIPESMNIENAIKKNDFFLLEIDDFKEEKLNSSSLY